MGAPRLLRIVPNWRGAKSRAIAYILHKLKQGPVVEIFGGTGTLALNYGGIAWNDLDTRLYNLAKAIRDDANFPALCRALPDGTEGPTGKHWKAGNDFLKSLGGDVDAWEPEWFAWYASFSFAGRLAGRVHCDGGKTRSWHGWIETLFMVGDRLGEMEVTRRDALDVIAAAPPYACIYADPPYGHSGEYAAGIDDRALWAALQKHPGQVMLSGYTGPDEWRRIEISPAGAKVIKTQGFAKNRQREFIFIKPPA